MSEKSRPELNKCDHLLSLFAFGFAGTYAFLYSGAVSWEPGAIETAKTLLLLFFLGGAIHCLLRSLFVRHQQELRDIERERSEAKHMAGLGRD